MNETTFKGDVAELIAASELVKRGYVVSKPLTNGAPYDLLVDAGGSIRKVQIKRISRTKTGAARIKLTSSKYHRGRTSVSYSGKVDYVLGVECESMSFFVVSGDDLNMVEIAIRETPTKNNQSNRTRSAEKYHIDTVFPSLLWCEVLVSNQRPPACEAGALPLS